MTQKHYIEIAAMLRDQMMMTRGQQRERVAKITLQLALIMKRDNPRFKASKFFDAAGFPELTGTQQGLN
jgi:hypothetical protein